MDPKRCVSFNVAVQMQRPLSPHIESSTGSHGLDFAEQASSPTPADEIRCAS
ncbi:hypothetical protein E8E13_010587 [Curvularia kusanoi]|uniref:Uncharacterized protein n=1 Tax=Curvularia kusanoi TaxID=90978 RepID=A0A9P4WER3_CURKU|nr:hypothetical protein E8E13_010587 [Curvularia kusanoi]